MVSAGELSMRTLSKYKEGQLQAEFAGLGALTAQLEAGLGGA